MFDPSYLAKVTPVTAASFMKSLQRLQLKRWKGTSLVAHLGFLEGGSTTSTSLPTALPPSSIQGGGAPCVEGRQRWDAAQPDLVVLQCWRQHKAEAHSAVPQDLDQRSSVY